MPLSLTAEQKNILKIFRIEEQYIVPSYQRPYSWEYDQCFQLYNDLMRAFLNKDDYFIGNIVIARNESNKDFLELVDGQQRLITLLLLIKVLAIYQPDLTVLPQLLAQDDWKGENRIPRIKTEVFESRDDEALQIILESSRDDFQQLYISSLDTKGKIVERKVNNKFTINSLYFYQWIGFYADKNTNLEDFTTFLLKQVYLLPIELSGKTRDEANEKALVIFETINNRGMSLEDADIFKAKLFNKAKKVKEDAVFIDLWTEFKSNCDMLNLSIDDIFRYYSHIIRGQQGITYGEKSLRDFFTGEGYSPFELKKYKEILDDLSLIIEILEFIKQERTGSSQVTSWLQILELYTNQYPKYAIVNYLFVYGLNVDNNFEEFLKSLVRFAYYQGSTATVKFEIYNIIKQISHNDFIKPYHEPSINPDFFNNLGRLKKGFALLAFYLQNKNGSYYQSIDRILSLKDQDVLADDWNSVDLKNVVDNIGNYIVLTVPKRNLPTHKRLSYYSDAGTKELDAFIHNGFKFADFKERENVIKLLLADFFKE